MTKRIALQIDGGGIRGITPAIVLAELEKQLRGKMKNPDLKMRDLLSLCCGTSTGAIIAGMVCAGVDGIDIEQFYSKDGVELFQNSKNAFFTRIIKPKYKRDPFIEKFNYILEKASPLKNKDANLGQLPGNIIFMATAYNLCSLRTHFVKSDDAGDRSITLRDVITWSGLSAAYYFGKVDAPQYKWFYIDSNAPPKDSPKQGAVFQDGGQGTQNCTLGYVLTETLARRWDDEEMIIISLGTGNKTPVMGFADAVNLWSPVQAVKYLLGQARKEATPVQIMSAQYVSKKNPKIKIFRLDYESTENYPLDDADHADVYRRGAQEIINSAVFQSLVSAL